MSSVNPTRVNGEELQQAERLKHGDVITIIDRSFRWVSINTTSKIILQRMLPLSTSCNFKIPLLDCSLC